MELLRRLSSQGPPTLLASGGGIAPLSDDPDHNPRHAGTRGGDYAMPSLLEEIYLVPFEDRFLLHAPLHGVTSLVNPPIATELRACLETGRLNGISATARPLGEALFEREARMPAIRTGPFSPGAVSLLPTLDCNLRCLYCAPGAGAPGAARS